jgi:hypothetical protein
MITPLPWWQPSEKVLKALKEKESKFTRRLTKKHSPSSLIAQFPAGQPAILTSTLNRAMLLFSNFKFLLLPEPIRRVTNRMMEVSICKMKQENGRIDLD